MYQHFRPTCLEKPGVLYPEDVIPSIATAVIPVSVNVYMLAVVMFFNGVATGALDSGKCDSSMLRMQHIGTGRVIPSFVEYFGGNPIEVLLLAMLKRTIWLVWLVSLGAQFPPLEPSPCRVPLLSPSQRVLLGKVYVGSTNGIQSLETTLNVVPLWDGGVQQVSKKF